MTNKQMKKINIKRRLTFWAIIVGGILTIPVITKLPWTLFDFIFAGLVLFILATIYELTTQKMTKLSHKLAVGVVLLGVFVLIWGWAATGPD